MREKAETPSPNSNCCRKPLSHLAVGLGNADLGRFSSRQRPVGRTRRQCRPSIRREACGFEEISRFSLWRLVSCAVRRQQVEPGTARPAAASGCRLCRPSAAGGCRYSLPDPQSAGNPADSKKSAASVYGGWFRVLSGGSKWKPVLLESAGPTCVFRDIPENRRIRELEFMVPEFVDRTGGSEWVQAQPARPSRSSAASCAARPSPQPAGLPSQAAS